MQEEEIQEGELPNVKDEEIDEEAKDRRIYNSNKYISRPKRVQDGTVPINILEFQYPL